MAIEARRGCGFRKVGGMYLCGEFISSPCDRMPFPLTTCPICGQGIKVSRGFTQVNPYRLWGPHDQPVTVFRDNPEVRGEITKLNCTDRFRPCLLCDPQDEPAYIMLVGAGNYKTKEVFLEEAHRMGISKRIPFIPKGLELCKTAIYLAHPNACEVREPAVLQQAMAIVEETQINQPRLLETEKVEKKLGIFCAFIPKRVETLVWESELTDEKREQLENLIR